MEEIIIKNRGDFAVEMQKHLNNEFTLKTWVGKDQEGNNLGIPSTELKGLNFTNITFNNIEIRCLKFVNCKFVNATFYYFTFENCYFYDCTFVDCTFYDSKIMEYIMEECNFINCLSTSNFSFSQGDLILCLFENSDFRSLNISYSALVGTEFKNCSFRAFYLQKRCLTYRPFYLKNNGELWKLKEKNNITFYKCEFARNNVFYGADLTHSKFIQCNLFDLSFIDSYISNNTFNTSIPVFGERTFKWNIQIDFKTIVNSEELDSNILHNLFSIKDYNIRKNLISMVFDSSYYSVFISFSYKDRKFAEKINTELAIKNIDTFLWVKDAPAGQNLERIMIENTKKYDKVLFICSEHSLRSKACQFELTQGRIKAERKWEETIYPIHLDNYFLNVEKYQIRPADRKEEYWQNILEIRNINSISFIECKNDNFEGKLFDQKVSKLINDLRKKTLDT